MDNFTRWCLELDLKHLELTDQKRLHDLRNLATSEKMKVDLAKLKEAAQ